MSRGFAVNADDSWAGWYGHEQNFAGKGFPAGVSFIAEDDADPRVSQLRAERDAPPPPVKPAATLADIWAVVKSKTGATDADLPAEVEPPKTRVRA